MFLAVVGGLIVVLVVCVLLFGNGNGDGSHGLDSKPIPGPRGLPFVGNVHSLDKTHMQRTMYQWMKEYGQVFKFSFFGQDIVVLNDPKLMREVFSVIVHRPILFPSEVNFNHSGAGFTSFEGNQQIVKDITFQINRDTYKDPYIEMMQDEMLDEFINGLISQEGGVVDVDMAVFRSIGAQFYVEQVGQKPTSEVLDTAKLFLSNFGGGLFEKGRIYLLTKYSWLTRIPGPFKRSLQDAKISLNNVVSVMQEEAKRSYKKGDEHGMIQNFMSRKEEENKKAGHEVITDENMFASVIAETILLAYAGTTGAIVSVILYMLLYPDHLAKVQETIEKVKETKRADELVEDDVPYLIAVIMESMRLSSLVCFTIPHEVQEDVVIGGFQFKKGQIVNGCIFNVHLSEETWGDPFKFRPERFLDPSGQMVPESNPLQQAWVPFGVGGRYCNGKYTAWNKIFKYVSRLLYRCDIKKVDDNQKLPSGDPRDFESVVALLLPEFSCKFVEKK